MAKKERVKFVFKAFYDLTTDELYALLHLRSEVFVVEQDCVYLDIDYKDQKAKHLLAFAKNNLVAYVRIFESGDYFANTSIGRVVVHPNWRRKDFGKELMQKAIRICKEEFTLPIEISAQCYLQKFYTDLGFERKGSTYLEDDIPHVKMLMD